jgi:hypothetical protein
MYFSELGPRSGLLLRKHVRGRVIDVRSSGRDRIGTALPCGWDGEGAQFWKLVIHGDMLPGRFVVIDREFRPEGGHVTPTAGTRTPRTQIRGDAGKG